MLLRVRTGWLLFVSLLEAIAIVTIIYHDDNELQTFKECKD